MLNINFSNADRLFVYKETIIYAKKLYFFENLLYLLFYCEILYFLFSNIFNAFKNKIIFYTFLFQIKF